MAKAKKKIDYTPVTFEEGQKYRNMKGAFKVLSIDRDNMRIRWDSGEEIETTVSLQSRIVMRMKREQGEGKDKGKGK